MFLFQFQFPVENRVQTSQDCLLPLSQQQSAYQRDPVSLENNVIKSSSSKAETIPYQQVPTYLNTTDRFRQGFYSHSES